jgi:hypothetical protein
VAETFDEYHAGLSAGFARLADNLKEAAGGGKAEIPAAQPVVSVTDELAEPVATDIATLAEPAPLEADAAESPAADEPDMA